MGYCCWRCNHDVPAAEAVWLDRFGKVLDWRKLGPKERPRDPAPYHAACAAGWVGVAAPDGVPKPEEKVQKELF